MFHYTSLPACWKKRQHTSILGSTLAYIIFVMLRFACPNRMSAVPSFLLSFSAVFMFAFYCSRTTSTTPVIPVDIFVKYNLMEETFGENWAKEPSADKYLAPSYCTIEYANTNQLQQDHPCVIRLIRQNYLRQPAPKNVPYNMSDPETIDPSDGQSEEILRLLHNQTNGFFIECGGFDGEFLSNTLYMERSLDWSGLLIEADKKVFTQLISRNRKAFTSPACLSTKPFPMEVVYNGTSETLGAIIEEKDVQQPMIHNDTDNNIYKMQCFPLYSILLAVGRTDIDYFGLDVEGAEYKILKTIPWYKVNIKTVTVEWNHVNEGEPGLTRLMESNKFTKTGLISNYYTREVVYIQNSFNIYREK